MGVNIEYQEMEGKFRPGRSNTQARWVKQDSAVPSYGIVETSGWLEMRAGAAIKDLPAKRALSPWRVNALCAD